MTRDIEMPGRRRWKRMAKEVTNTNVFVDALVSSGPATELEDVDHIFGFLVGSCEVEAVLYDASGRSETRKGEVHASWVLEGRAIQDLFIFPRRADRPLGTAVGDDRYATTIRTYDRRMDAWRVNFINPAADETSARLIAAAQERELKWKENCPAVL